MGWNSWNRFGCEVNCDIHPFDCISQSLLMEMADAMVLEGLKYVHTAVPLVRSSALS
jgi:hypothetical protein